MSHPIDVAKTQSQLNRGVNASLWATMRGQAAAGGMSRLYRGVLPVMVRPTALCMYTGNEWCKRVVAGEGGKLTLATATGAGFLSGFVEAACVTPWEVVKVRMQSTEHLGRYSSSLQAARQIVATEGPLSLFTGLGATCARNAPFNGLYFGLLFAAQSRLPPPPSPAAQFGQNLGLGCAAGAACTLLIAPFDVVKSRLQNQRPGAGGGAEYSGTVQALRRIVAAEGAGALWKGLGPLLTKVVVSCGVSFAAFHGVLGFLERSAARRDDALAGGIALGHSQQAAHKT